MGTQSLRLKVGSIYTKGPGKIYYFRYQVEGHRKTVSLQTTSRAEALKKAQTFQPVIQSSSMDVIAAHVSYARGLQDARRDMLLADVWNYYERRPDRATPATVSTWNQYEANLREFVEFINNPLATVREITAQRADEFAQYLRTKGISVHCHNRKIKHLRRIFATLGEFRSGENPFSAPVLFRKQREKQGMGVRRQAFSRDQEQKLLCVLAVLHGGEGVVIHQEISKHPVKVILEIGHHFPLHSAAPAKAILAFLPPRRAEEIIRGIRFTPYTPKTIRDERKFLAELESVRKNGFACDRGEEMEDLRCVAAPIRDTRRGTVSAVWITGPASRLTEAKMKKYAVLVRQTALQIEDKIN